MSTIKRFNGDYTFNSIDGGQVIINAADLILSGNIQVGGNSTVISTTQTSIIDNIVTLNKGEAGAGITLVTSGMEIDRGSLANVSVVFDDSVDSWQLTNDGISWANIVTSSTGVTEISEDASPQFTAPVDVNGQVIFSSTGLVTLSGNVVIAYSNLPGASVPTTSALTASNVSTGGTGLYVNNETELDEELISKKMAIGFSFLL